MAKSITATFKNEKDWQKWDDAHALLRAQEVLDDATRSKAAKKMAAKMAKEKVNETTLLMKIAQEAYDAIEATIVEAIERVYEAKSIKVPKNAKEKFKVTANKVMKKKGWTKTKAVGLGVAYNKKKNGKK